MEIVVKGLNVEVPDHYRVHVVEKLAKIERYDNKIIHVDVELFHEPNPRQSNHCQRVEITCISRGPVLRAEARAKDFYSALDAAIVKLDTRLRRVADRRRARRSRHAPASVEAAAASLVLTDPPSSSATLTATRPVTLSTNGDDQAPDHDEYTEQPWRVVRKKEHPGEPMTIDDALFRMELVGHDFYLFNDKDSGRPSVVYRRKGFDYGVITLAA